MLHADDRAIAVSMTAAGVEADVVIVHRQSKGDQPQGEEGIRHG